ncbi:MAG: tetratricopeptide repeat protein, partial [Verrucomicrobiota bacterium]
MPTNTEEAVPAGFDPIVFWMENKSKVITYAALLLVGLTAFAAFQISTQRNKAEAESLFAQATKPEEFKALIQKFPRSLAAGNAQLMLAEALRTDKKYDEALASLRDFVTQFPNHPLAATG